MIQLVHELCSIRAHSVEAIAGIWREFQKDDRKATGEHMAASKEAKVNKGIKLAGSRANKLNNAMEVDLVTTKARLLAELKACGKFKSTKIEFLKKQVTGRVNRKRKYPRIPIQFKTKNGKQIKVTPPKGEEVQYLQELSLLMIKEDRAAGIAEDDGEDGEVQHAGFLRSLPPISAENCQKIGAVGLNSPVMGAPWIGLASLPGSRLSHPDSPVV